mgnify:CR=1 FL=1
MIKYFFRFFTSYPYRCSTKGCKNKAHIHVDNEGYQDHKPYCEECFEKVKEDLVKRDTMILKEICDALQVDVVKTNSADINWNIFVYDERFGYETHSKEKADHCQYTCWFCNQRATNTVYYYFWNAAHHFVCDSCLPIMKEREKETMKEMLDKLCKKYGLQVVNDL